MVFSSMHTVQLFACQKAVFACAFFTLISPLLVAARQIPKPEARTLEVGRPVEANLSTVEIHIFLINVPANHYLQIVGEQLGIDLQLTLRSQDRRALIRVDLERTKSSAEVISIVAQAASTYLLEVSSAQKVVATGRYKVRIETLEPTTEANRANAEARLSLIDLVSALNESEDVGIRRDKLKVAEKLAEHFRSQRDTAAEVRARLALSRIVSELGDKSKASELDLETVKLCRDAGNVSGLFTALSSLGQMYEFSGQVQKALDLFTEALSLARKLDCRSCEVDVLIYIGWAYYASGDWQRALAFYSRALPATRALKNFPSEAFALIGIGGTYMSLQERDKALAAYSRALRLHQLTKSRRGEAYALHNLAWLFVRVGKNSKALVYNYRALTLMKAVGDRSGEAYILASIGSIYRSRNDLEKAAYYYSLALPLRRAVADRNGEAETLYNLAEIERARRNFGAARAHIESAVTIVEAVSANTGSQNLRATFAGSRHNYYELYVDMLMQAKLDTDSRASEAEAFQINERSRARSLLELLHEARADIRKGVDAELLTNEQKLQTEISSKTAVLIRLLNGKHTEQQAVQSRKEIEELTSELQVLQGRIRLTSPQYAALTQLPSATVSDIQALLDPETVLLEYALGAERSYVFVVASNALTSVTLSTRRTIEAAANKAYSALTARARHIPNETIALRQKRLAKADAQFQSAATELGRELLTPVKDHLGGKRLVIVSDGALQYIPFAALPDPNALPTYVPLIEDHEIVNLPSASTLALLRQDASERPAPSKTAIVFADPVFESTDLRVNLQTRSLGEDNPSSPDPTASPLNKQLRDFLLRTAWVDGAPLARLPYSRTEAEDIAELIPKENRKIVLDFDVNYEAVTSPDLANYRFIHFATHGLLDPTEPELSGVLLSLVDKNGQPQRNGILRLGEIYNLKLPVDTVILSACETALGKSIKGEGLIGLTRGFMYAGATRVMATLWKVDDVATADLVRTFYRGVLGPQRLRPAAALHRAQQQMWKREKTRSPFYWAGFVMQGDWR